MNNSFQLLFTTAIIILLTTSIAGITNNKNHLKLQGELRKASTRVGTTKLN